MSAGDGYKYLLRTVATGDVDRTLSTPLIRYYNAEGTPPGRWMGAGLPGLGDGSLAEGSVVSEAQLQLLIGAGRDPLTGEPMGRAYPIYKNLDERIPARVDALDSESSLGEKATATADIEAEEATKIPRRAVAGFDFTFSIPKSASVLWAVSNAPTQQLIADAHHAAVAEMVAFMEREVAATRTGANTGDGAVAQVDVRGLIATAYDHFDSRAGDPHLHTHVVISNKVQAVLDGKWRSLDSRPMHAATVAISELHEAVFADRLPRALGIGWETRDRGKDRNPVWAIAAIPETLTSEFSSRSRHIDEEKDRLIAEYVAQHGHRPSATTIIKLRAQATLATRPAKTLHSLGDLTAGWRARASKILGTDATTWASSAIGTEAPLLLRAEDVPLDVIEATAARIVEAVSEKRSTWRRWNLTAEAARQFKGYRFESFEDREAITGLVTHAAERVSLRLTPFELASSPVEIRRSDDSSVFRPKHSTVYTSHALLAAEDRLLDRTRDLAGPKITATALAQVLQHPARSQHQLGDDQASALTAIATSGRVVDLLVGPAGAGKTTAMRALRHAWEAEHGAGSVVGLAPSAGAAEVLSVDLGIATENTAKWWQNHLTGTAHLEPGQLIIVDTYLEHGRIADGDTATMINDAYAAWKTDRSAGRASLLVSDSNESVHDLNERARTDLILEGIVTGPREAMLRDEARAAEGDTIITRKNDRRLQTGRGWVRNGDRWTVLDVRTDGALLVRRAGFTRGSKALLPADYVAEHVDLGYAVTSFRAQGVTVDSAHVLVDSSMTRENLYVAMTRGRHGNRAYVAVDRPDDAHETAHPADYVGATGRSVLYGVLQHQGVELSAHETLAVEQERWGTIAQLAAEYDTLATAAQHDRWADLIRRSGLGDTAAAAAIESEAFGPLAAEFRRAEAYHHDLEALLPKLVMARPFEDADDIAAVLRYRVAGATARFTSSGRTRTVPRLIAGLLPEAVGAMSTDMRQALEERRDLIEARADAVLDRAAAEHATWTMDLGKPPTDARPLDIWRRSARVVAAYRDRYQITTDTVLGAPAETTAHKRDQALAEAALKSAHRASRTAEQPAAPGARAHHGPRL
ncbi:relaxase domain-containing protein [Leucobacter sp. Marseille-Q4368]|uniref:Relaxase domain-containing protein n=2 Tax=Leucobacter manosquensis TaxID=2810611 RepID=A0ABS5M1A1_9MICO|nr:relaxase domain-containing protein [Leucobacter manosquensis]